jgi:hypothetical protein
MGSDGLAGPLSLPCVVVPACPRLSLFVPVCPRLSLFVPFLSPFVPVCPRLSLFVPLRCRKDVSHINFS